MGAIGLVLCGYLLEQVAAFLYLSNRSSCSLLGSCSNCLLVMPASFPAPLLWLYVSTISCNLSTRYREYSSKSAVGTISCLPFLCTIHYIVLIGFVIQYLREVLIWL